MHVHVCMPEVLHPRYKDSYFRSKGWKPNWITTAIGLLQEIWEGKYKPKNTDARVNKGRQRAFDTIDDWEGTFTTMGDELDNYLSSPTVHNAHDPIIYWRSQACAGLASEAFAQMAIDYLACPGKSACHYLVWLLTYVFLA